MSPKKQFIDAKNVSKGVLNSSVTLIDSLFLDFMYFAGRFSTVLVGTSTTDIWDFRDGFQTEKSLR